MKRYTVTVFALVLFLGTGIGVQAIDSPFVIENVPNVVGVGAGIAPDYLGSEDYSAVAAPFFRWTFKGEERYLQLLVSELSFNMLDNPNFTLGPVLNYRFGRDDSVDDKLVRKMQEINDTVEAGIFTGYIWKENANPRHRFITSAEFLHDIGGEHDGWVVLAGARYWYPIITPIDVLVGVGATYGSSQYMDTYFGVSSKDAARTGLKRFDADGGFRDVNAQVAAVFHFSMNWHIGAGAKYYKLSSDAADSPIVDDRGDDDQWIYGIAGAYSW